MSRWLLLTAVLSGCGGVPVRAELQPLDVRVEVVAPQVDPLGATEAELVALHRPIQPRIGRHNRHTVALSRLPIGFDQRL